MKRIIKNNYQPNSVRVICPICKSVFEFNPEFDLEAEEFSVYRNGEIYIERQISCPCCTRMLRIDGTYPYRIRES